MIRSNDSDLRAHERVLAVAHRLGLEALEAEVEDDQVANMRIVFDDQNAGHSCPVFHSISPGRASGAVRPQFFHTRATALPR